jgi:hypothetical protein
MNLVKPLFVHQLESLRQIDLSSDRIRELGQQRMQFVSSGTSTARNTSRISYGLSSPGRVMLNMWNARVSFAVCSGVMGGTCDGLACRA